jgi:hypothetical protein
MCQWPPFGLQSRVWLWAYLCSPFLGVHSAAEIFDLRWLYFPPLLRCWFLVGYIPVVLICLQSRNKTGGSNTKASDLCLFKLMFTKYPQLPGSVCFVPVLYHKKREEILQWMKIPLHFSTDFLLKLMFKWGWQMNDEEWSWDHFHSFYAPLCSQAPHVSWARMNKSVCSSDTESCFH